MEKLSNLKADKFNEVDISLYHLHFLGNSIENNIKAFENIIGKIDSKDELIMWVSACSITILQTVSFIDEYNNFIKSKDTELNLTILAIKKAVKPALKEINAWKDLRLFRNNVLAHNLRNGVNATSIFSRGLSSYDIPKTGADFFVLYACITMIRDVFKSAFGKRLSLVQKQIDQFSYPQIVARYKDSQEANKVSEEITSEINANILKLKTSLTAD